MFKPFIRTHCTHGRGRTDLRMQRDSNLYVYRDRRSALIGGFSLEKKTPCRNTSRANYLRAVRVRAYVCLCVTRGPVISFITTDIYFSHSTSVVLNRCSVNLERVFRRRFKIGRKIIKLWNFFNWFHYLWFVICMQTVFCVIHAHCSIYYTIWKRT